MTPTSTPTPTPTHQKKRRRRLAALLAAVAGCVAALLGPGGPAVVAAGERTDEPSPTAAFTNPIVDAPNAADPSLVHHEGAYYHLATTWGSHWEIRSAPTLGGLRGADPVRVYEETEPSRCCNFWAPELRLLDGPNGRRWYITYTAGTDGSYDNQHVHVLESEGTDPMGPYTYKGQVEPFGDNRWMIDSSYYTAEDGSLYLLFSAFEGTQNVFIVPLENPWAPAGPPVQISAPTYDWETVGDPVNEGPVVLQHDGRTFLTVSASFCGTPDYKLGLLELTGSDPLDPAAWTKFPEPVFERDDAAGVYGPGHNNFFTSPDGTETWMVYHANDSAEDGCGTTRTTRAQKVEWNEDGTPDFGTPAATGVELTGPSGE
jgi:GH43 family beta-xylosidase